MRTQTLIVSALIFSACSGAPTSSPDKQTMRHGIVPISQPSKKERIQKRLLEASIARGKVLYQASCIECHGPNGAGDGSKAKNDKMKPADLSQLVKEVPNFTFFISISQWSGQMPGWKDPYSSADREDLVNYIKTFR